MSVLQLRYWKITKAVAGFLAVFASCQTALTKEVRVGMAVSFPPFVELDEDNMLTGMAMDLLQAMNEHQSEFRFVPVLTNATRRHEAFKNRRFDISMFDHKRWGWKDLDVEASRVIHQGAEIYIARKVDGRDQSFFENLESKMMVGTAGYHYGFAGFNSDPDYLREHFSMQLPGDPMAVIRMIHTGRGDVGVVTRSLLNREMRKDPTLGKDLLISEKLDQPYAFSILVRRNFYPDVNEINLLLRDMEETGALQSALKAHGG